MPFLSNFFFKPPLKFQLNLIKFAMSSLCRFKLLFGGVIYFGSDFIKSYAFTSFRA